MPRRRETSSRSTSEHSPQLGTFLSSLRWRSFRCLCQSVSPRSQRMAEFLWGSVNVPPSFWILHVQEAFARVPVACNIPFNRFCEAWLKAKYCLEMEQLSQYLKKGWLYNYFYGVAGRVLRTEASMAGDNRSPGLDKQVLCPVRASSSKEAKAASTLPRRARFRVSESFDLSGSQTSLEARAIAAWHVSVSSRGDGRDIQACAVRNENALRLVSATHSPPTSSHVVLRAERWACARGCNVCWAHRTTTRGQTVGEKVLSHMILSCSWNLVTNICQIIVIQKCCRTWFYRVDWLAALPHVVSPRSPRAKFRDIYQYPGE